MASKTSASTLSLFAIATLLLVLSLFSVATSSETHNKTTPFGFLDHLKGCHKGDKVEGVRDLKKYLERFGYLNGDSDNDDFDDMVESAVKTYQLNYNLNATGTLDSETLSKMMMPRCGVADIINGTTSMRSAKKRHSHDHYGPVHTVAHFSFFNGSPKWPSNKYHLTYAFNSGTPTAAIAPVARAFAMWAVNTHFSFTRVQSNQNPDLTIGFNRGDHGDGAQDAFDGEGGTLAHAFAPTVGKLHFDADEKWAVGAMAGRFDIETVALHEIGHLLGLSHSSVEGAVMFPTINPGFAQGLHGDDVQGIKALYNT